MTTVERTQKQTAYEWLEDGRYVDSETYHGDHSIVGNSAKERFVEAPFLYEAEYVTHTSARKVTSALRIGVYSHVAQFEPDVWRERFICKPEYETDGRTAAGKADRAQFAVECIGKTEVKREEYLMAEFVVAAIRRNKLAAGLLDEDGPTERPIVWQDERTGLWLKNKQDKFITGRNWIIDLKTKTGSVKPDDCMAEVQKRGLYRNADFYLRGHLALTGELAKYLFLFVSKTTGEVCLTHLSDEWLADGFDGNRIALRDLARSKETGIYIADHETKIIELSPPAWKKQILDEESEDEVEDGDC